MSMPSGELMDEVRNVLAHDIDRVAKAKAITELIRKDGGYCWGDKLLMPGLPLKRSP
jgi:hypothetical protein